MTDKRLQASFSVPTSDFRIEIEIEIGPEIAVLFGPSGSGKTMTLRSIVGLVQPEQGFIRLGEQILFDTQRNINLPPQERCVGYVPQDYALFPHLNIAENIAYGLHDQPRMEKSNRVEELLHLMRLEPFSHRKPAQVSGGQQQRTALARALARRPDLLLMDEPFGALDESLRVHLRDEIQRVQSLYRIPMIFVTHSLEDAYSLGDKVVVVNRGRILQIGDREDVFRKPRSPDVARQMGMINILETRVEAKDGEWIVLNSNGYRLRVPDTQPLKGRQSVTIGIRPEDILFIRRQRAIDDELKHNLARGVILDARPIGFDRQLTVAIKSDQRREQQLIVRIPHPVFLRLGLKIGEERSITTRPSSIHVFP